MKKLWIGIAALVLLSPLGLILPAKFGAGSAWGEWSSDEITKLVGYLPAAFRKPDLWSAPVPDYAPKGHEDAGFASASVWYIASAVIGIAAVAAVAWLLGKVLTRKEESDAS